VYKSLWDGILILDRKQTNKHMTFKQLQIKLKSTLKESDWRQTSAGGWIQNSAKVEKEDHIRENAIVMGKAQVSGNAWIFGNAVISGNAHIYGNGWVSENAQVYEYGQVYENAQVRGNARVAGHAKVYGHAQVFGDAEIFKGKHVDGSMIVVSKKSKS